MGTSTDGIVFFGMTKEVEEGAPDEWPNNWCISDYELAYGRFIMGEEFDDVDSIYDLPEEQRQRIRDHMKEWPIEVDYHGSSDYEIPYIYIKGSREFSKRGYAAKLNISEMESFITEENKNLLRSFAEKMHFKLDEPDWYLVSYWSW